MNVSLDMRGEMATEVALYSRQRSATAVVLKGWLMFGTYVETSSKSKVENREPESNNRDPGARRTCAHGASLGGGRDVTLLFGRDDVDDQGPAPWNHRAGMMMCTALK